MIAQPRERGILFSAPMIRALQAGTKTQTRRAVQITHRTPGLAACLVPADPAWARPKAAAELCPYAQPGDRLWVREAWRSIAGLDGYSGKQIGDMCTDAGYRLPWAPIQYEEGGARVNWEHVCTPPHDGTPTPGRYRHARFTPRWASRITLEISGVRVERLNDISEADAHAEGVDNKLCAEAVGKSPLKRGPATVCGFAYLWDCINGVGSWDANPWVWVIEFRRIEVSNG